MRKLCLNKLISLILNDKSFYILIFIVKKSY
jgi:hypothetical protein